MCVGVFGGWGVRSAAEGKVRGSCVVSVCLFWSGLSVLSLGALRLKF